MKSESGFLVLRRKSLKAADAIGVQPDLNGRSASARLADASSHSLGVNGGSQLFYASTVPRDPQDGRRQPFRVAGLQPVGNTERKLMPGVKVDPGQNVTGDLGHTKVEAKLGPLCIPASARKERP